MMNIYRFEANGILLGDHTGTTQKEAQDAFAIDAGYASWAAMVEQAKDVSPTGNTVEVFELNDNR